jgi:hypothetical protein
MTVPEDRHADLGSRAEMREGSPAYHPRAVGPVPKVHPSRAAVGGDRSLGGAAPFRHGPQANLDMGSTSVGGRPGEPSVGVPLEALPGTASSPLSLRGQDGRRGRAGETPRSARLGRVGLRARVRARAPAPARVDPACVPPSARSNRAGDPSRACTREGSAGPAPGSKGPGPNSPAMGGRP